jgi:hypothetical protein
MNNEDYFLYRDPAVSSAIKPLAAKTIGVGRLLTKSVCFLLALSACAGKRLQSAILLQCSGDRGKYLALSVSRNSIVFRQFNAAL